MMICVTLAAMIFWRRTSERNSSERRGATLSMTPCVGLVSRMLTRSPQAMPAFLPCVTQGMTLPSPISTLNCRPKLAVTSPGSEVSSPSKLSPGNKELTAESQFASAQKGTPPSQCLRFLRLRCWRPASCVLLFEMVVAQIEVSSDMQLIFREPATPGVGIAHANTVEQSLGSLHFAVRAGVDGRTVPAEFGGVAGHAGFFQQGLAGFGITLGKRIGVRWYGEQHQQQQGKRQFHRQLLWRFREALIMHCILQMRYAQAGRRMGIVERGIPGVGGGRCGIVAVQLEQGADQMVSAGLLGGVAVRLKFMAARIQAGERVQQEGEHWADQQKQHQRHGGARAADAQAMVEPRLRHEQPEQPQAGQAQDKQPSDALVDMVPLEMPQFVRQHCFDLTGGKASQQGVEKHDTLGATQAGEISRSEEHTS